jgi:histidyl-tRNA synthetase
MSKEKIQAPRGTLDTLPEDAGKWQTVERIARDVAALFNFKEIRTPVFEHTELFHRGAGETTDIVRKETYDFKDRGDRALTLRPEGTAGVVRAMIEHGYLNDQGARAKVYYIGANFRYERPQKGRYHIHHQFGVEAFGVAEPDQDVECILLQLEFYRRCGLRDLSLRINSLGDLESKSRYRDALVKYFEPVKNELSEDSQRRLGENPLRILDSKDERDVERARNAPPASEYLTEKSRAHIERVAKLLDQHGVTFSQDPHLVRGFDYYTDTLWEVTAGGLGAQNAVGGGGRYDNLVEQLGGRPTPGVGFGSGLERLLLALETQQIALPQKPAKLVWIAYHGDAARRESYALAAQLRGAGFNVDLDLSGRGMKGQLKSAEREAAVLCVVIGDDELANGTVQIKSLATREQSVVKREEMIAAIGRAAGSSLVNG